MVVSNYYHFPYRSNSHSPSFQHIVTSLYPNDPLKDEHPCKKYSKIICLFLIWFIFMSLLTVKSEKHPMSKHVSVPADKERAFLLPHIPDSNNIIVSLHGAFLPEDAANTTANSLIVYIQGTVTFKSELNSSESVVIFRVGDCQNNFKTSFLNNFLSLESDSTLECTNKLYK